MLYTCLRWSTSARAHVHPLFPYLANGCSVCVKILCVAWYPLDLTQALLKTEVGCTCTCARAHLYLVQNGGLSNCRPHEQPTFGPQRYPKSAASQVTEGWLNMRQQLFVRIVVFSMKNQPERSRRGRIFIKCPRLGHLETLLNAALNFAENFSE